MSRDRQAVLGDGRTGEGRKKNEELCQLGVGGAEGASEPGLPRVLAEMSVPKLCTALRNTSKCPPVIPNTSTPDCYRV